MRGTDKKQSEWKDFSGLSSGIKTISLQDVTSGEEKRILTADAELNRVLGGGIVTGSLVLIAGEPGIGKSTLFLQAALQMQHTLTLYISGEESEQQIKMRADRIKIQNEKFSHPLRIVGGACGHARADGALWPGSSRGDPR